MVANGTQERKQGDMLGRACVEVASVDREVGRGSQGSDTWQSPRRGERQLWKELGDSIPGGCTGGTKALGRDAPGTYVTQKEGQ